VEWLRKRLALQSILEAVGKKNQLCFTYKQQAECLLGTKLFSIFYCSIQSTSQYRDWLWDRRRRDRSSSPSRGKNFPFSMSSRPVLVPTTTSHTTGTGGYSQEVKRPWCEAVHSQLLQSSRTREPTHSLCHTPS
jgi:hypothetical protein